MKTKHRCLQDAHGNGLPLNLHDVRVAMEEYKDQHVNAIEKKYEADYKRFKEEYKGEADSDALCYAISDAEQDIQEKHVKPLQEQNTELTAALLKVRDRHIKNPITYNIITKALNYEK